MDPLVIAPTGSSPAVNFDPATHTLALSGESYPENALAFFRPLLAWMSAFLERDTGPVVLELRLTYMNTSSIKSLMDLLDDLEEAHQGGRSVTVNWYYDEENHRALDLAEEFKEDLTMPFHLIPERAAP